MSTSTEVLLGVLTAFATGCASLMAAWTAAGIAPPLDVDAEVPARSASRALFAFAIATLVTTVLSGFSAEPPGWFVFDPLTLAAVWVLAPRSGKSARNFIFRLVAYAVGSIIAALSIGGIGAILLMSGEVGSYLALGWYAAVSFGCILWFVQAARYERLSHEIMGCDLLPGQTESQVAKASVIFWSMSG